MVLSLRPLPAFGLLLLGWALILLGHYYAVPAAAGHPWLIALSDPAVHALVAVVLVLPFYLLGRISAPLALLRVALAVLIDLDHAVAAGSLHPARMISLPARPLSHSLLFALLAGGGLAALWRGRSRRYPLGLLWYLFGLSLASHVLRDAADGNETTPWAWPAASPAWPAAVFFGLFCLLSLLHLLYAARQSGPAGVSRPE
jgi:membrane-bound metal-dependent hydrolase YbcI (DUF457 family)